MPFLRSLSLGRRSLASWGALGFLLVAALAAGASSAPNIGLFGTYLWGTGWLLWLGCAGAFGIGLRLRGRDLEWLFGGLLVGAVANSILALYQRLGHPASSTFGAYQGNQADGFLGNPIFLESLLLGVIALVAVRAVARPARWAAFLLLMAVALEFTTERFAVPLLALLMIGLIAWRRLRGLVVAGLIALGYAIGYLGGGSELGSRIAQGTTSVGYGQRLHLWRLAAHAVVHRPLIGYGPGELEAGINPLITHAFAKSLQVGTLFSDGHDVFVEVVVTTGILGLVCFLVWLGGSFAQARNAFVLFALLALAVELVEPLNVAITPLVFLSLGAAQGMVPGTGAAPVEEPPRLGSAGRLMTAVLVALALALGASMVAGDIAYNSAPPRAYQLGAAKRANELLFYWPDSAAALTQMYRYEAAISHPRSLSLRYLRLARTAAREAADRLPFDPLVWVNLGDAELSLGNERGAVRQFDHALREDPFESEAFEGLGIVAADQHRWALAVSWFRKELSVLGPSSARAEAEQRLADAEHHRPYKVSSSGRFSV